MRIWSFLYNLHNIVIKMLLLVLLHFIIIIIIIIVIIIIIISTNTVAQLIIITETLWKLNLIGHNICQLIIVHFDNHTPQYMQVVTLDTCTYKQLLKCLWDQP